jgi:hypothetical protein
MTDKYKTSHLPVDQIDKLRFQAFKTNSPADMDAYYRATSSYFQDYPRRAMNCEVKEARITELEAVLAWYKEQVYFFSNGTGEKADEAYNALEDDGGKKAREALKGEET